MLQKNPEHEPVSNQQVLTAFGTQFVREVSDPTVVAVFRLAIAEPEAFLRLHPMP
jgi:hypothetical protein